MTPVGLRSRAYRLFFCPRYPTFFLFLPLWDRTISTSAISTNHPLETTSLFYSLADPCIPEAAPTHNALFWMPPGRASGAGDSPSPTVVYEIPRAQRLLRHASGVSVHSFLFSFLFLFGFWLLAYFFSFLFLALGIGMGLLCFSGIYGLKFTRKLGCSW